MDTETPRLISLLSKHIDKLKVSEASSPATRVSSDGIVFWGTFFDKEYISGLKGILPNTANLYLGEAKTIAQVQIYCTQKKVTKVITTSTSLLAKLLSWEKKAAPKLSDYAGSYFRLPATSTYPAIEIVFIPPLKQLFTVSYGRFLVERYVRKLTEPYTWFKATAFNGFTLVDATNEAESFKWLASDCVLISIDIETFKENAVIRCISFTGFKFENRELVSKSYVFPLDSEYMAAILRKWCWNLKAPKVFQNGRYDIAYLTRYSAPVYNYVYDTANMMHCMYSELPKDLGFLNAFFIREAMYWKDLSETNDLHEYYKYNALDTWGTGNAFLAMMHEAAPYAINNYKLEFPLTFACHLAEMTGIKRDISKLAMAREEQEAIIAKGQAKLDAMLGIEPGGTFNVKSAPQKKQLLTVLGCKDLNSTDEKNLKKARLRHPLNARIIKEVLDVIKARTLISNYLTEGKEFNGRFLYALSPAGTDSGRLASKSHHFWCGDNIQKIPRGKIVKQTFKADPGFMFAEIDLEQAESRDTAYISGEENLIHNVEFSPDFHCANASAFFGIPFEKLYDVATHKKLNVEIRDLAKRVNHGANYNMGAYVLLDTMGEENVAKARTLLDLPRVWTYITVCEYLLDSFHKTYPKIKDIYYVGVVAEVLKTRLLASNAVHHDPDIDLSEVPKFADEWNANWESEYKKAGGAWTRYCFGNPDKSKLDLNSYVAHPPQSLNAMTLNKAYLKVFLNIALNPKHSSNFKLCAQIHDSILFQYREGHEYLCDMVKHYMEVPVTIKAYDGKVRTFIVPAGIKKGDHLTGADKGKAKYWSMTE